MSELTRQQVCVALDVSESTIQRAVPAAQPISLVAAAYPS